jgi:hypothetical protein
MDPDRLPSLERASYAVLSKETGKNPTFAEVAAHVYRRTFAVYTALFEQLATDKMKQLANEEVQFTLNKGATGAEPKTSLTYGEIDFNSFADILERLDIHQGDTLVDLGSGTGKALVTAALLFAPRLARIHGIELLSSLHSPCSEVLAKLRVLLESNEAYEEHLSCKVTCELGDILATDRTAMDWTVADIIFMNSTLFDTELMVALCQLASLRMRRGTRVVTLTRPLPNLSQWKIVDERQYRMSWGTATSFVHVKM